ncbi:MAG: hypothetical protein LBT40_15790 [Deltaproteobacteria bacterium]|nr:hypothetical protein [Deltaproteobacteria bacterium]
MTGVPAKPLMPGASHREGWPGRGASGVRQMRRRGALGSVGRTGGVAPPEGPLPCEGPVW